MDLAALRRKTANVRVMFDGETLDFTYNPHAYDDECQRVIHALSTEPDNTGLSVMFDKLITSWDMKDGVEQLPCTYESFMSLPPFLRTKIVNAIIEDEMERGKLRGSDNSSNREARSGALVPIGSRQSPNANGQDGQNGATTST